MCVCVCVLWSLTSSHTALTFTLGKEADVIISPICPPVSFHIPGAHVQPNFKVVRRICHPYLNLNHRDYFYCIFFLSLSLARSVFIPPSPFHFLTSFFYLGVVESLPNEVADGSILQGDRVERSPTLKSINLTVSISMQTSLSYESKRRILA